VKGATSVSNLVAAAAAQGTTLCQLLLGDLPAHAARPSSGSHLPPAPEDADEWAPREWKDCVASGSAAAVWLAQESEATPAARTDAAGCASLGPPAAIGKEHPLGSLRLPPKTLKGLQARPGARSSRTA
jgi:hypothetical protein